MVTDVHRAQQTANVKKLLQNKSTLLINLPPGCTSQVQPLDVSINKPYKHAIREQFEKHLRENKLKVNYLPQKEECLLQDGLRKVWKKITKQKNYKEIFITIEGIPDYKLPHPDRVFEMDDSSDEEDDDEVLTECEEEVNDNESDSEGDSDSD